ncbi:MAG TPA: hypothetical protein DGD08_01970 [Gemmatimonas aurantiaca]|uniref:Uncharacterized protein n=2 Tax=Gemmatimonas aurantiaca TaxID=173480 RepID=C1AAS5_GEMAT|nr:hypothetical protein [Gemmatimonas aurantiaca]BAH39331.1 hypothetical protein GAU_2289 [Gemmatimonas aurantiaca T-27]HCT55961.1 hypothetical protein [Gemmatimonas aurantiaca]
MARRSYRTGQWTPKEEREEQIREQLRAGVTDPATIASALGCTKDLVMLRAREMPDVERRMRRPDSRTRRAVILTLRPTRAPEVA